MSAAAALLPELERLLGSEGLLSAAPRPGAEPLPLAAPADEEQLVQLLRFAARERLAVVPTGLGSKLGWTAPPARADLLVSTRRLQGVVSHVPADGTLSARAGTTMAALRAAAREGGHFVTPDVCRPERATLGGVLAAAQSGFDRLRFGPVRHHVLGMRVALADGRLARTGGQLVKNVTGYDLHKLYTGSHGTLCVIVEAALRLFPEPEHECFVTLEVPRAALLERARAALALPARMVALTATGAVAREPWTLAARLFGRGEAVEAELHSLQGVWDGARIERGEVARAAAERARDSGFDGLARPWLRVTCRPSRMGPALEMLERELAASGAPALLLQPGCAQIDAELPGGLSDAAAEALIARLRAQLGSLGAQMAARGLPAALAARLDPFGAPAAGLALMRRLKDELDPTGVFAPGRFHGGL